MWAHMHVNVIPHNASGRFLRFGTKLWVQENKLSWRSTLHKTIAKGTYPRGVVFVKKDHAGNRVTLPQHVKLGELFPHGESGVVHAIMPPADVIVLVLPYHHNKDASTPSFRIASFSNTIADIVPSATRVALYVDDVEVDPSTKMSDIGGTNNPFTLTVRVQPLE